MNVNPFVLRGVLQTGRLWASNSLKAGTLLITFFRICLVLSVQQLLCLLLLMSDYSHGIFFLHVSFLCFYICQLTSCYCATLAASPNLTAFSLSPACPPGRCVYKAWGWAQQEFSVLIPEAAFCAFCKAAFQLCGGYDHGCLQMSIQPLSHPTLARIGRK